MMNTDDLSKTDNVTSRLAKISDIITSRLAKISDNFTSIVFYVLCYEAETI